MLVSISIVAYNEEDNIEKSLSSALNQSYNSIEVFLIDNASEDKTIERAKRVYEKSGSNILFSIIKNSENLGFGGGHNVGFKKSSGDLILCLNADCELDKNYVQYAVGVFKKDEKIGAVQGKLINPRTGMIDTAGLLIFKNRRVINRGQGEKDSGQYNNAEEVWGVDGAAPIYRRVSLEDTKIGEEYFDEDFFAYKEDVDLSWRLRWAGWRMQYEPRSFAFHDRSAGEGVSRNLFEIIKARRNIGTFAKFHSFGNQRLMQIKNENPYLFLKHLPTILLKEFLAWPYILVFEPSGIASAAKFFRFLPKMLKKRKFVMLKKRISNKEMEKWFV